MRISHKEFEKMVSAAVDSLPEKFFVKLHNVVIVVEDFPSREHKKKLKLRNDWVLLGLFEGLAQSRRLNFGPVLPDKITLFRQPIMNSCSSREDCQRQITSTLKHEIAHHFGLDEAGARRASRQE